MSDKIAGIYPGAPVDVVLDLKEPVTCEEQWFTCDVPRFGLMEFRWAANAVGSRRISFLRRVGGRLSIVAWQNSGGALNLHAELPRERHFRVVANNVATSLAVLP